jgi:hypothetical protein
VETCVFGDPRSVHVRRVVPGLVERGLQLHIVCHRPVEVPGATVERFEIPRPSVSNLWRWRGRWNQYLRILMHRFDVVNVHFLHDWGFMPQIMEHGCYVASPWGSDIVPPLGQTTGQWRCHSGRVLGAATGITPCQRFAARFDPRAGESTC